ncbi:MAG TPA: hypothetical protein PK637_14715 [Flavobacteriales bacterium]|nr:hypothetical protein [Flavobacteriales bacterium]HRE98020.1 hypothetical protein [Flavobacteriales bacterium]HRJ36930.1 hypothetical protein [Flavobacteriales bacterium]HRJ39751.1 hypothetical protein [Flavobacteriales bacterium]
MKSKRLFLILSVVAVLLAIPAIAMQFTDEVKWDAADFLLMGLLLLSTGILIEVLFRSVKKRNYRIIGSGIVLGVFLLVWAELAVGIFD